MPSPVLFGNEFVIKMKDGEENTRRAAQALQAHVIDMGVDAFVGYSDRYDGLSVFTGPHAQYERRRSMAADVIENVDYAFDDFEEQLEERQSRDLIDPHEALNGETMEEKRMAYREISDKNRQTERFTKKALLRAYQSRVRQLWNPMVETLVSLNLIDAGDGEKIKAQCDRALKKVNPLAYYYKDESWFRLFRKAMAPLWQRQQEERPARAEEMFGCCGMELPRFWPEDVAGAIAMNEFSVGEFKNLHRTSVPAERTAERKVAEYHYPRGKCPPQEEIDALPVYKDVYIEDLGSMANGPIDLETGLIRPDVDPDCTCGCHSETTYDYD